MSAPTDEPIAAAVADSDETVAGDAVAADPAAGDAAPSRPATTAVRRRGAPLPVAALVAVCWAVGFGLLPVVVLTGVSAIGTGASVGGVVGTGVGAWLLAHGVPVGVGGARITLVPLGVTAWLGWRMLRAGVHASRATGAHRARSVWPAVRAGVAVGVGYGVAGVVAAEVSGAAAVTGWRVLATVGAFGTGLAVIGALQHSRAGQRLLRRGPRLLAEAVRAGCAAVLFLLAAGAATAGLALALQGGAAAETLGSYRAGVAGQLGITAGCLAYLPNLAVWAAGYLVGPGFAVGVGTVVSPSDVLIGPVPVLPVFAALPSGPLSGVGPALLGVPLAAGIAAGLLLGRRRGALTSAGWLRLLAAAALAGPVAGVVVQCAVLASRGGLGAGRMAVVGVTDPRVALIAAGVISLGTVVGAATRAVLRRP